jgi:hypothetical protein
MREERKKEKRESYQPIKDIRNEHDTFGVDNSYLSKTL